MSVNYMYDAQTILRTCSYLHKDRPIVTEISEINTNCYFQSTKCQIQVHGGGVQQSTILKCH